MLFGPDGRLLYRRPERLSEEEANADALIEILDEAEFAETIGRRRRTAEAIKDGLLRRELFVALATAYNGVTLTPVSRA